MELRCVRFYLYSGILESDLIDRRYSATVLATNYWILSASAVTRSENKCIEVAKCDTLDNVVDTKPIKEPSIPLFLIS